MSMFVVALGDFFFDIPMFNEGVGRNYLRFILPFSYDVIPVVYGMGYKNSNLPEKSYIDVFNFESIKHLAEYLKYLDGNDTAYNEYFKSVTMSILFGNNIMTKHSPICSMF